MLFVWWEKECAEPWQRKVAAKASLCASRGIAVEELLPFGGVLSRITRDDGGEF